MSNNVTIKDIAKACNVSTATVSYVINNKEGQSISEETRKAILHAVNMLNYKPSVIAKNLRTLPQHKLVAIYTDEDSKYLNKLEYLNVIDKISTYFSKRDMSLIYGRKPFKQVTDADAIISYNLSKSEFRELGETNYIPLIALDSLINDDLFFQVTTNFNALKEKGDKLFKDYIYVGLTPSSSELKAKIIETFKECKFVSMVEDLSDLPSSNIVTDSKVIFDFYSHNDHNKIIYDSLLIDKKIEKVVECIEQALSRNKYNIHFYEI